VSLNYFINVLNKFYMVAYIHKPEDSTSFKVLWHLLDKKFVFLTDLRKFIYWNLPWPTILSQFPLYYPTSIGWRNLFLPLNPSNHCLLWSLYAFTSSMWTMFQNISHWVLNSLKKSDLEEGSYSLLLTPKSLLSNIPQATNSLPQTTLPSATQKL